MCHDVKFFVTNAKVFNLTEVCLFVIFVERCCVDKMGAIVGSTVSEGGASIADIEASVFPWERACFARPLTDHKFLDEICGTFGLTPSQIDDIQALDLQISKAKFWDLSVSDI